jgi:hypothetical protein
MGQGKETPLKRGISNPLHTPATPERSLAAGEGVSGSSPLVGSLESAYLSRILGIGGGPRRRIEGLATPPLHH